MNNNKNERPLSHTFLNAAAATVLLSAMGFGAYAIYAAFSDRTVLTFDDLNNADRCLSDVLDNDGVLRTPLPVWKDGNADKALYIWAPTYAAKAAAHLTPEIVADCEQITGQKHNPAWHKVFALRPQ